MDTQREALEKLRQRLSLPEGGTWNYNLGEDRWMYQYSTGPDTFSVTAGVCRPEPTTPTRVDGGENGSVE